MGNLAVRKVVYNGKKYYFESPYLEDGIVILEGVNGHGKSTFMNLIYYGLGGKVPGFNKNDKDANNKHTEIYNDEDNYVELEVEINNKKYELTRTIGDNIIFIVDEDKNVTETCVFRNQTDKDTKVFSDWILGTLGINVFDIVQGTRSFKLNFSDLMRLIYHDQLTEVDKIYKEADNSNFLSDSLEIRKAIFEVLLGKIYNKYYSALGNYKLKSKELEKNQAIMDSYDDFLNEILSEDLSNVVHIKALIVENENMRKKVNAERNIAISQKGSSNQILKSVDEQRNILAKYQSERDTLIQAKSAINQSIDKIIFLIDEAEKELQEIEKIRLVNKKLKLFSPNTCPYCLRDVERIKGKCICGEDVDEEQYEKFFYTDHEYFDILKVKKKAISSLSNLLDKKNYKMKNIVSETVTLDNKILNVKNYINELMQNITCDYNSAYIRQLDNRECELNAKIIELQQAEELAQKRENISVELIKLRKQVESLKIETEVYLSAAKEDMLNRKSSFSDIYLQLMKLADAHCYAAYIGDDYMPNINFSQYRERSASVPKRLMFFLTMLIQSLQTEVNFPKFLMIDTPNKEGIDKENLIKNITLLSKANEVKTQSEIKYQIILTTGIDTYPDEYKDLVFLKLDDQKYLLKEKNDI
ncbi:AAA family ATPase [Clostridium sp. JN-1]|uniref:AAA family ATPase n=1 Tax=Clostridium sp. JN-1 TaxID=2483110 RepID=UPI000F0B0EE0|nr:AAA family ATPase [Clostridium sp. JN-1]